MNAISVPPVTVVWLHGDFVEDYPVHDYAGAEPQTGYLCRACDLIVPAEHLKQHPRTVHLGRYKADYRRLLRLAARGPIVRGCDPEDNLIERGLQRERERPALEPEPTPRPATAAEALAAIQNRVAA